ncbi:MAG TPA: CinA family nicotinamide mononucleotide deamidase-related protein [Myxococcaceae bacterium]|nr:CinA family nicotinamide mononucleotide deamidase-related protein [Myxococcaceae bacterium]
MKIEVICTGDELLTGITTDTNSPYFMGKLFALGEQVTYGQVVPDDREAITQALRGAASRADAVLVSGGLGPTADDLTAECAAVAAGVPMVQHEETLRRIQARFIQRGMAFTPNNARQAQVPAGAEVVTNAVGTAPMFIQRVGRCTLFFVPGVPKEYRHLVDYEVLPRLKALIDAQPDRVYRAFRLLKTVGLAESHLDAKIAPLAKAHASVTFGYRTHAPENHLKLLAHGPSQREADETLSRAAAACREVLGSRVFGKDADTLAGAVLARLKAGGHTVATAESATGGLVAHWLVSEVGAGDAFLGGVVPYDPSLKLRFLGVDPAKLGAPGAVSGPVTRALADAVRRESGATFGLATTGYAGPTGGTDEDPVGTVYCALVGPGVDRVERYSLPGERERVRLFGAALALDLLRVSLPDAAPSTL